MMSTKRQFDRKQYERIISIVQWILVIVAPILFYTLLYGIPSLSLTPYYLTASLVFVLYRKNTLLNSFLLSSILPMLSLFLLYGNVVHIIPVLIAIIIFLEKDMEMNSFMIFSVISFTIYIIDVFIGVYQHPIFGNLFFGTLVYTVNILLIYWFFSYFRPENAKNRRFRR